MIETAADPARRGRRAAAATPGTYRMIQPKDWTMINAANPGRQIEPVPYTGGNEFFEVNMTYAEMVQMKDENSNIRYKKCLSGCCRCLRGKRLRFLGSKDAIVHDKPHDARVEAAVV